MLNLRTLLATSLVVGGIATAAVTTAVINPFGQEPQAPKPTAEHEMLLSTVGEWEGTLTMTMPGMPEMAVPATETIQAVGGFWTSSDFKCDFMGMPFHGHGIMGYDVAAKKMVGTWADGMSSYLAIMEGSIDADTATVEMKWEAPVEGAEGMVPHRNVTKHEKDAYTITFFNGEGDAEVETMTIAMKRKK